MTLVRLVRTLASGKGALVIRDGEPQSGLERLSVSQSTTGARTTLLIGAALAPTATAAVASPAPRLAVLGASTLLLLAARCVELVRGGATTTCQTTFELKLSYPCGKPAPTVDLYSTALQLVDERQCDGNAPTTTTTTTTSTAASGESPTTIATAAAGQSTTTTTSTTTAAAGQSTTVAPGSSSAPTLPTTQPTSSGTTLAPTSTPPLVAPGKYRTQQPYLFQSIKRKEIPSRLVDGAPFPMDLYGPTYLFVDYRTEWKWSRPGGDWIDANLVRHG